MFQYSLFLILINAVPLSHQYTFIQHLEQGALALRNGLSLARSYGSLGQIYTRKVAFSARLSKSSSYSSGRIIPFKYVSLNEGSRYYTSSGIFKAPSSGLYHFAWTVKSYSSGKQAYTDIRVNGKKKVFSYCGTGSSSYYDTCTQRAVLQLSTSDQVGIYVTSGTVYLDSSSSFEGAMIT